MKRRSKIRAASFAAAVFSVLLLWAVTASVRAEKYERFLRVGAQQSLTQLCEYLDNIEIDLMKSLYAGSPDTLSVLSAELSNQAAGAKTSLSALTAGDAGMMNTYKFLSQVGEYTRALNRKAADGGRVSAEERQTLEDLLGYAVALSSRYDRMAELMNSGYFTFEKADDAVMRADGSENTVSYIDSADDAEQSMTDFPTLIYDGPFSDNILSKESELLKNAEEISPAEAKKKAAGYLGTEEKFIVEDGETGGRLAVYNFRTNGKNIAVTKHGGYLASILSDTRAGTVKLTDTDAIEKGAAFLYNVGYTGLMSTYYSVNDGVCTVNFAFIQDGFVCYPDLVKIGVSLSDGAVVSLDASDYLMNHTERTIPELSVTAEQAAGSVAETLSVKKMSLAVIPTKGGGECFAHELLCEGGDGQDVLVYKDIVTGKEDDILILLYSDNGVLTK